MNEWLLMRTDGTSWVKVSCHKSELRIVSKLTRIVKRPDYDGREYMIVRLVMLYAPERKPE